MKPNKSIQHFSLFNRPMPYQGLPSLMWGSLYEKNAYIKLNPLGFDINLHNIKSVCSSTTITLSFDFIFVG